MSREAPQSFAYEHTDIPVGLTIRQWREQSRRRPRRVPRLRLWRRPA